MKRRRFAKKLLAGVASCAAVLSTLTVTPPQETKAAAETPRMIVDMTERQGEILHGASGFLYGISSEDVPTTDLITPLKPTVLATKGMLGTEHPYGDAADVAETFLMSGGKQVQMYTSNYYAIFGPRPDNTQYAEDLKEKIVPAVVEWKDNYKERHGTPDNPKDELGKIDIDEAIVYLPINEGSPQVDPETGVSDNHYTFYESWKLYYDAIKEADPGATVGGPNDAAYGNGRPGGMSAFLKFCAENDCWPDVQTWHDLGDGEAAFAQYPGQFEEYRSLCRELDMPEQQIVINEYATPEACGVPGVLIRYMALLEENNAYGCLPFWHQANNLNDLAADANEPNAAWWFYKWYADMTGERLAVTEENTTATGLTGISTIDDEKAVSSTLFGGVDGDATVVLKDLASVPSFEGASKVHVKLQAAYYKGYLGATEPETVLEGTMNLTEGNLVLDLSNVLEATGYNLIVTPADEEDEAEPLLVPAYHELYEAEDADFSGGVTSTGSGGYYGSGRAYVVNFSRNAGLDYTIQVPADGRYKLEFVYGNGIGTDRGNEDNHKPVNKIYQLSVDGSSRDMLLTNTMLRDWTTIYTEYVDLTEGEHKISIRGDSDSLEQNILFDVLHVTYAGAYGQETPLYNTLFEAEDADFNTLKDTEEPAVYSAREKSGYSGQGYVSGLSQIPVTDGGGIRWAVKIPESGLYNISLRYQSDAETTASVYVGNTALTFDGRRSEISLPASEEWQEAGTAVYLEKGMNLVDVDADADILLDYMRIRQTPESFDYGRTVNAVDAVPEEARMTDVPYYIWKVRADANGDPELYKEDRTVNKTARTEAPSGTEYVVGRSLSGDKNAADDPDKYLEFTYHADEAGIYAMQIFHSNDEIFGTHGYNTKIIDKFACVQVNGQTPQRYFFINSLARDTFKEKTVFLNLEQGENTIKIFNDDSWSVLKGLDNTQADAAGLRKGDSTDDNGVPQSYYMDKPGNIPITNSLPNLSKFVITPSAESGMLDTGTQTHKITIRTSEGGLAVADKNAVEDGGQVTFTVTSDRCVERASVNGEPVELTEAETGKWTYTADGISEDTQLQVIFTPAEKAAENQDPLIANNSFGTGDTQGWSIATSGSSDIGTKYFNQYGSEHYLRLSGGEDYVAELGQTFTVPESGIYSLNFRMKNKDADAESIGEYNSIEFTVKVGDKTNVCQMVSPAGDYKAVEGLIYVPENESEVSFSLKVDAKSGFEVYLDDFALTPSDIPRDVLAYFVDCGDHNPATLPDNAEFGLYNSVTDQIFGADPATGKQWGVYDYLNPEGVIHAGESRGAFTANTSPNCNDGQADVPSMTTNYRYASGQDGNSEIADKIGEIYVDYKFELNPGETYNVEVCVGNNWSNSSPVNVYANYLSEKQLNGEEQSEAFSVLEEDVRIAPQNYAVVKGTVKADEDGILTINVRRPLPLTNATINVNYIYIRQAQDVGESLEALNTLVEKVKVYDTESLPEREKAIVEKALGFAEEITSAQVSENDLVLITNASETLKYAVNEVNKVPDSSLLYFVDCGDHGVSTVTDGDRFGQFNTRTDQVYGEDPVTGMLWGVDDPNGSSSPGAGLLNDEAVYTKHTWAHEWDQVNGYAQDNLDKNQTFRYARDQRENGIDPRYVTYRFQVDSQDGIYPVEVGLGNNWGNSANPDVYANLGTDRETVISEEVSMEAGGHATVSAEVQAVDGFISVDVRSDDDTINVNWIRIGLNQAQEEKPVLTGIEVKAPDKAEYEIGEELDLTGMTVTARYSDGSAAVLESGDYSVEGFSSEEPGEKTVTVSCTEGDVTKTASFTVYVKDPVPAALDRLQVTAPLKTEYEIGEKLDLTGMTVTAVYSDGSEKILEAADYIVSGFTSEKPGEIMVTVSYTEGDVTQKAEFTVTVVPGEEPGEEPGENPGEKPGEKPGENPGEEPGENPGQGSGENPGGDSGKTPDDSTDGEPGNNTASSDSAAVQTGDSLNLLPAVMTVIMSVSVAAAVIIVKYRKKTR